MPLGSLQETETPSDKIALIREIHKSGNQPVYYILRHNIQTDKQAFEYEAMAIDLLSLVKPSQQPLTNIQGGHTFFKSRINGLFGIKATI